MLTHLTSQGMKTEWEPGSSSLPAPFPPEVSRGETLMTHFFLQLTINPETGEGSIMLTLSQPKFTIITFYPRLVHVILRRFGTPYYPVLL